MSSRRRVSAALLGLLALVIALYVGKEATDDGDDDPGPSRAVSQQEQPTETVGAQPADARTPLSSLPPQAGEVWLLIQDSGPFPYRQDGQVFGNRERRLPAKPSGYYREFTIPTPGEDDRGARRFVLGLEGELYYTADHYESFHPVDPDR